MKYKSNRNVVYSCKYHAIWCSKYRRKVLINGVDIRLKEIIYQTAMDKGAALMELEIMPDHVHLLVEIDPQYGVNCFIAHLKGVSSRMLRQEFSQLRVAMPALWTNSYFVSTVGGAPLAIVKQNIENQKNA